MKCNICGRKNAVTFTIYAFSVDLMCHACYKWTRWVLGYDV